jgi:hypothetical protein
MIIMEKFIYLLSNSIKELIPKKRAVLGSMTAFKVAGFVVVSIMLIASLQLIASARNADGGTDVAGLAAPTVPPIITPTPTPVPTPTPTPVPTPTPTPVPTPTPELPPVLVPSIQPIQSPNPITEVSPKPTKSANETTAVDGSGGKDWAKLLPEIPNGISPLFLLVLLPIALIIAALLVSIFRGDRGDGELYDEYDGSDYDAGGDVSDEAGFDTGYEGNPYNSRSRKYRDESGLGQNSYTKRQPNYEVETNHSAQAEEYGPEALWPERLTGGDAKGLKSDSKKRRWGDL